MEGPELLTCSVCHDQPPELKCYCLEMPMSLCTKCSIAHFLADSSVPHRPFPVEMKDEVPKDFCEVCKVSAAVSICTCMFPWISYCADCAAIHMGGEVGHISHTLEPLNAKEFLQSASSLPSYYERQHFVEELQSEVKKNTLHIADCIAQINSTATHLISTIEGWRDNMVRTLSEIEEKIQQNVDVSWKQLEAQRYQPVINPMTRLEQLIILSNRETIDGIKKELNMLKYTLETDKLLAQLPYLLRFSENYLMLEQVNKLFYAIPRTNKLVTFDLPELLPRETILNTDFKFKSASAWCKLTSGEIFLCGGVRQRNGATYYKEVILIDPSTRQVKPLPSMRVTRCRHAVLNYRDSVYVFGGYNEALLRSCEKFDMIENTWSDLPDLKDGKDCVTAAVWRDRAYLVGYGSNKVEVYDFATGNMFTLPVAFRMSVMNLLVPKHCAVIAVMNGEITMLMESEVLRINVDGQATRSAKLPGKLERAWYSQCSPVVVKGEDVLFFNLDQELWKLNLPANELKLVLTVK